MAASLRQFARVVVAYFEVVLRSWSFSSEAVVTGQASGGPDDEACRMTAIFAVVLHVGPARLSAIKGPNSLSNEPLVVVI
jgi:hypothetical protein